MRHLLFAFAFTLSLSSVYAQDRCSPKFQTTEEKLTQLESWITAKPEAAETALYQKYKTFKTNHPQMQAVLPENTVYDLLLDLEMRKTAVSMERVLDDLTIQIAANPNYTPNRLLKDALEKNLKDKVPAASVAARIDEFMNGGTIYRALGEKTHEEVAIMFHGGNPMQPSADSILGKFIAKHQAATLRRAFSHGPGYTTFGQEKLVVAVDATMIEDLKLLMADEHLFMHHHTPDQGTLFVGHEGRGYHYGGSFEPAPYMSKGTILPTVFLSSTEAQRMAQYMKGLNNDNTKTLVQKPWLTNTYCAVGGYTSCTHWVGNMPIGDEVVNAYTFPGKVDQYAENRINPDPELDKLPRTQDLAPYEFPENYRLTEEDKALIKRIWKVPGNQQFAYSLGIGKANEYGQLANPGWVAHVFTSRIKVNRSPVIFFVVPNAKLPIAPDFDPQINAL